MLLADKLPKDHSSTIRLILLDPNAQTIQSWLLEYRPRAPTPGSVSAGSFAPVDSEVYEQKFVLPREFPKSALIVERARVQLRHALEYIRKKQYEKAKDQLQELEAMRQYLPDGVAAKIYYDRACVESLLAETYPARSQRHGEALRFAVEYLLKWLELGFGGAWANNGETERNEIHRMGMDDDLHYVLSKRRREILNGIPKEFQSALPKPRSGRTSPSELNVQHSQIGLVTRRLYS